MRISSFILLLFLISIGCTRTNSTTGTTKTSAYVPVYATTQAVNDISVLSPRAINTAGKIYAYNTFIYQNDVNEGIHIIDNSNRSNPQKVAFLKVPLSTEVAVKGNYLYTNNFSDLVVFDISSPAAPVLVKRIANMFPAVNQSYPPYNNVAFECADPSKGVVIGWELKQVENPKCRR